MHRLLRLIVLVLALAGTTAARGEDGYDLWLRYKPVEAASAAPYRAAATEIVTRASPPPSRPRAANSNAALQGCSAGRPVSGAVADGAIVIGTPGTRRSSPG